MAPRFLETMTADIAVSDEQYIAHERARFVPLSVNPFRDLRAKNDERGHERETVHDRPPAWIELAGDIAWTVTFSQVTSNTSVTDSMKLVNYAVFFGLTWHLWATQVIYDVKYYTNDWWHRALFVSQLAIYAALTGLSTSFNVGWELNEDAMNPFVGNGTAVTLTDKVIQQNEILSMERSLLGVNIVLFVSRAILFLQYLRVIWYRRRTDYLWSWRFYLLPALTLVAGCIFLSCFVAMRERGGSKSVAVTQLILWPLAIGIQILAAVFTPEDDKKALKSNRSLTARLSTLMVIILGEGLSGFCGTLRNSMNPLGMTPKMFAVALSILLIVSCIWLLYSDGSQLKRSRSKLLGGLWLWLHFPLHLGIIIIFEGIKNLFIMVNIGEARILLMQAWIELNNPELKPEHPRIEALLLPLKMSWIQQSLDRQEVIENALDVDPSSAVDLAMASDARWFSTVIHNAYQLFNGGPWDPKAEFAFNQYLWYNASVLVADIKGDQELVYKWVHEFNKPLAFSRYWLIAISGAFLIYMAILNAIQHRPRDQFAWGYFLNRCVIGVGLIGVGIGSLVGSLNGYISWLSWIIHTVAVAYTVACVIERIILYRSIRSIRRQEASRHGRGLNIVYADHEDRDDDWGRRANVRRFTEILYDQIPSGHSRIGGSLSSLTSVDLSDKTYGTRDDLEAFDPYAEAGVPHYNTLPGKQEAGASRNDS